MRPINQIKHYFFRLYEKIVYSFRNYRVKKNTLLVLRLDSIGDYILFRNFINEIKNSEKFKNFRITLCGNAWWKDLAESIDSKLISEFIWVNYHSLSDNEYRVKISALLRKEKFEYLLHPTFSRDSYSDILVRNSGVKKSIGYDGDLSNISHSQKLKNDSYYYKLITSEKKCEFEFYRNKFFFEKLLKQEIQLQKPFIPNTLDEKKLIVICPGAKDSFRRWDPENFGSLCDILKNDFPEYDFAICGSEDDSIIAEQIKFHSALNYIDYTGKLDLTEFLDLLCTAALIITNDSMPFHISVALNKPVACISNGNNYGRFSPYPEEMNTRSVVCYPTELVSIQSADERKEKFCRQVPELDINTITVQTVRTSILNIFPVD